MLDVVELSLGGEPETAMEERAMSARLISVEWHPTHKITAKRKGQLAGEHTAVALQSILADLEGILAVLVGDAAGTAHWSGCLWLGVGGCGTRR